MAGLSVHALGAPEAWRGDQRVHFPTRKALALLLYLSVDPRPHTRDELMALFWPESDGEHARMALRTTLTRLRVAVGDGDDPARPFVLARDDVVALHTAALDLDIGAVQRAWEVARARTVEQRLNVLREAAARYRGDFLAGFSLPDAPDFDDWAATQRETWHQRMTLIFDRLAQAQFDGGDIAGTLDTVARWIALYPLDEAAHRLRMLALFTGGDRPGALAAFERCRQILETELNAEPAPETVALASRLRQEAPPARDDVIQDAPALDVPFTGRGVYHTQLVTEYRRTLHGEPRIVVLEGEPGIGKTRLAREFLHWVGAQGAGILAGSALETLDGLPYHPLKEAVRPHLHGPEGLEVMLPEIWRAELARLFPEIGDAPAPPGGDSEAKSRLSDALAQAGLALSRPRPVVWLLDDLQWADAASLDTLQQAIRLWTEQHIPLLLLVCLRSDDADSPLTGEWLGHMARAAPLVRLTLTSLDAPDAMLIVRALAPDADETTQARIFRETQGHPLFLIESVRSLLDGDDLAGTMPRGIRAAIEQRLGRLGATARVLITAAAVLAHDIAFDRLHRVAGVDEDDALAACEEACRRRLLHERGARYEFPHDRIREVAYASAGEARRQVFHRRALAVLEEQNAPAVELSRHARAARLPARAFTLTLRAGDDALHLYAVRDAIQLYREAESLLTQAGEVSPDQRRHLALQLGRACELAGQIPEARAAYEELLVLARTTNDPVAECAALNRLAGVATLGRPDLPGALRLLSEARAVAERADDRAGLAETLCRMAQIQFYVFDLDNALAAGQRALEEARRLEDRALLARVHNGLAYIGMGLGHWEELAEHAERSRSLYASLGDRTGEADSMLLASEALIRWGRPLEAVALCRRAFQIQEEIGSVLSDFSGTLTLVHALLDTGQIEEAVQAGERGLAHARAFRIPPYLVFTLCALGTARRVAGDLGGARALHEEALQVTAYVPHPPFLEISASEACADCARAEDWEAASGFARLALRERDLTWPHYTGRTRWFETAALLHAGERHKAAEDLQVFGERLNGDLRFRIACLRSSAVLARWDGRSTEAGRLLDEGDALARQFGINLEPICFP